MKLGSSDCFTPFNSLRIDEVKVLISVCLCACASSDGATTADGVAWMTELVSSLEIAGLSHYGVKGACPKSSINTSAFI